MEHVFRRVEPRELEQVFALIDSPIAWMERRGLRQWNVEDYWKCYPKDYYRRAAENGELHVLAGEDGTVAAAACLFEEDRHWDDGQPALYVHNFAACENAPGAGREFLRRAGELAACMKKTRLRLDCRRDSESLNRYYENQGFRAVGLNCEGIYKGVLREKSDLPGTPLPVNVLLFDDFTALDAFGPVEILHRIPDYRLAFVSCSGGTVRSSQGLAVETQPAHDADHAGILLVPGGMGTRKLVQNREFLNLLADAAQKATYCLSVCTGSALLAACGVLDGRRATSNKRAFDWAASCGPNVNWQPCARWVPDGKFYTSSGVSAGMDMALGFVSDRFGRGRAEEIARAVEYIWNGDPKRDPFAVVR